MAEETNAVVPLTLVEALLNTARTQVVVRYELRIDQFGVKTFWAECLTATGFPSRAPENFVYATLTADATANRVNAIVQSFVHCNGVEAHSRAARILDGWLERSGHHDKTSARTFLSPKAFAGVLVKEHFDHDAPKTILQLPSASPAFVFYTGVVAGALQTKVSLSLQKHRQNPGLLCLAERFGAFAFQSYDRNMELTLGF